MFKGIATENELRTKKTKKWLRCGGLAVLAMASCSLELSAQTTESAAPTARTAQPQSASPAETGGAAGGGPDARRLRGQVSRAMERRTEAVAARRSVVPRCGLSLRGDGNVRGPLHDFDGRVSGEPRDGGQRLVGPRGAEDGDLHERSEREKLGVRRRSRKAGIGAWRMQMPAFAEELKFQTGGATRVVTFSVKARSAITMAGHKGDAVTWVDRPARW